MAPGRGYRPGAIFTLWSPCLLGPPLLVLAALAAGLGVRGLLRGAAGLRRRLLPRRVRLLGAVRRAVAATAVARGDRGLRRRGGDLRGAHARLERVGETAHLRAEQLADLR